jgi:hypothetical protein
MKDPGKTPPFYGGRGAGSGGGPTVATKGLLIIAAIASVVVYGLGDLASGLLYDGYSYRDQWISGLSAFGSPVRSLIVTAILLHGLLLLAFGVGIWQFGDRESLHWVGLLLMVAGVIGFPTHAVFAMSSRWMTAGLNDTIHASLSLAFGLVVFVGVALSAVAYSGWFWLYAIATILIFVGFGAASSVAIQGIEQNYNTVGWDLRAHQRLLLFRVAGRAGRDRASVARSERRGSEELP